MASYDGGNTTGFPSPATIYLEDLIDLIELLDLRRPNRYPVRLTGADWPEKGIADRDILVVDAALDRKQDAICVVMASGETFLATLKQTGPTWHLVRRGGLEVALTEDTEVWAIVTSIVREAV